MCEFVYWALPCVSGVATLAVLLFHGIAAFINAIKRLKKGDDVGEVADELADELEDAIDRAKEEKKDDIQ